MRYLPQEAFVANTDRAWFDFFAGRSRDGRVDEVNFWLPRATTPMREMAAGELIFFRLKKPDYAIAGYGFFAHFQALDLDLAWQTLGEKNGDPTRERFFDRIGRYRGIDLLLPTAPRAPIGCTILRDAVFWPPERWILATARRTDDGALPAPRRRRTSLGVPGAVGPRRTGNVSAQIAQGLRALCDHRRAHADRSRWGAHPAISRAA